MQGLQQKDSIKKRGQADFLVSTSEIFGGINYNNFLDAKIKGTFTESLNSMSETDQEELNKQLQIVGSLKSVEECYNDCFPYAMAELRIFA